MNNDNTITIAYFHQSADLYGSDRTLVTLIDGLDRTRFRPIVFLPCYGPLIEALTNLGIETHVIPMVKVSRSTLKTGALFYLLFEAVISIRAINRILAGVTVKIVHSNTLAVFSGALWARLYGKAHVWHVHEIIMQPRLVGRLLPRLVRIFSDRVVANSDATRTWLVSTDTQLSRKTVTIYNGIERVMPIDSIACLRFRRDLGLGINDLLVALVGRINRWKGQSVFVKAAEILNSRGENNIYYLIVGSPPPGQQIFLDELMALIDRSPARSRIVLRDFTDNIWTVWDACDFAVVPSTEPEPFGMVAIEAMASGKPIIGAAHGGLTEIIKDNNTGLLVSPGDPASLADAIMMLAKSSVLREEMGKKGATRQNAIFSRRAYQDSFVDLYISLASSS